MSTSTSLVYTSETGVESDEPQIIEHAAPTRVRINDATYGIKTGAKKVHDKVAREEFLRQRDEAIGRQRSREQARRDERKAVLDSDIAKIQASLDSGTSSNPEKAKSLLDTLVAKRKALV